MPEGTIVTAPKPRWLVRFKKGDVCFITPFNDFDKMILSSARASGAGYKVKTMLARFGSVENKNKK